MRHHWFRLSVDLDPAGHPIGISYAVRTDMGVQAEHVLPPPGPFDTSLEAFQAAEDDLLRRYGLQGALASWDDV